MPTTPLGITYPASTGHTRIWEHLETLADDVDTLLTRPSVGRASNVTSLGSIGTTTTAALTITGMVFKSGWAYRTTVRGAVFGASAGLQMHLRLNKTSTAGADWGEYGRYRCEGTTAGTSAAVHGSLILLRSAGTDLTADVVLAATASSSTVTFYASSASPRYLVIEPIGSASEYAGLGVDVT